MAQRRAPCRRRRRRPARSESCPRPRGGARSQPGPPGRTSCCTRAPRLAQLPAPAQPKAQLLETRDARFARVARRTPDEAWRKCSRSPQIDSFSGRLLSRILRDFPIRLPKVPPLGAAFRSMSTNRLGRSTAAGCLIGHTSRGCAQRRDGVKGMGIWSGRRGVGTHPPFQSTSAVRDAGLGRRRRPAGRRDRRRRPRAWDVLR